MNASQAEHYSRHILHATVRIGQSKALSDKKRSKINPETKIITVNKRLDEKRLAESSEKRYYRIGLF